MDTTAIARRSDADHPAKPAGSHSAAKKTGGKLRWMTLAALDGRTLASRRARELISAIENDLGGADQLTEGARQLVQRAAVLGTFIESCETKWLAGESVDLADYLAAVNSQRRVLLAIGIQRRSRDVTPPSLAQIMDELNAENEAAAHTADDDVEEAAE